MSGLDMSRLCDNWMPTEGHPELVASLPFNKILKLDMTIEHNFPPAHPRILLLQAEVEGQEIWGLRLWNERLRLTTASGPQQSLALFGNEAGFKLSLSYNPEAGGLVVLYNKGEQVGGSFSVNADNPWLPKTPYYTLHIGAPKHYADASPLGWTITADYNLSAPPELGVRLGRLVEVSPLDNLRLALQSIDSWRKVAEGALEALEKGAPS